MHVRTGLRPSPAARGSCRWWRAQCSHAAKDARKEVEVSHSHNCHHALSVHWFRETPPVLENWKRRPRHSVLSGPARASLGKDSPSGSRRVSFRVTSRGQDRQTNAKERKRRQKIRRGEIGAVARVTPKSAYSLASPLTASKNPSHPATPIVSCVSNNLQRRVISTIELRPYCSC